MRNHNCPNCKSRLRIASVEYVRTKGHWGTSSCSACGVKLRLGKLSRVAVVLVAILVFIACVSAASALLVGLSHSYVGSLLSLDSSLAKLFCVGLGLGSFFVVQPFAGSMVAKWVLVSQPSRSCRH